MIGKVSLQSVQQHLQIHDGTLGIDVVDLNIGQEHRMQARR
jgi:hypothetical protein